MYTTISKGQKVIYASHFTCLLSLSLSLSLSLALSLALSLSPSLSPSLPPFLPPPSPSPTLFCFTCLTCTHRLIQLSHGVQRGKQTPRKPRKTTLPSQHSPPSLWELTPWCVYPLIRVRYYVGTSKCMWQVAS